MKYDEYYIFLNTFIGLFFLPHFFSELNLTKKYESLIK